MTVPLPVSTAPAICWAIAVTTQCGFPSPADDHVLKRINLGDILIHQADATFHMRVRGDSMRDEGINDGDRVIVDRSLDPRHGDIVIAVIDNEYTIKTLYQQHGAVRLVAANPMFPDIVFRDGQELMIWGVVTWTLKQNRRV